MISVIEVTDKDERRLSFIDKLERKAEYKSPFKKVAERNYKLIELHKKLSIQKNKSDSANLFSEKLSLNRLHKKCANCSAQSAHHHQ